ncbi:Nitrile hydratase subunit alpha [Beijerinckiaceae bacterium RH AL1]|nr:nitrile hydratase subunit alpha [Beijerinckiaceae bacterium]VVB46361.1 Nitrile hydratase subunit alpha [Beijerinckiaceae bacterium RH CH11]VVB46446.1 Nitrile hydratase subunit alpha [Beijerinckiaceae bacterium RH AL8]VVC55336.1 Nitrile hydratase subunit alpha [Beijerinckiaceae bacterium RH AL1]
MTHDHDHDHHAEPEGPPTHYQIMEIALRELLIEKGVFTADDVRREVEAMEARTPATGARLVARAWVDPAFKARLLENTATAAAEMGIEAGPYRVLTMENTPDVHNMIVCTLCSCYPRVLLGLPPAWYKGIAYRARAVREPRAVLAEFGLVLPEGMALRVHDSTADMRYMVLPMRPEGTDGWDEAKLATLVTRDSLIGVAMATAP